MKTAIESYNFYIRMARESIWEARSHLTAEQDALLTATGNAYNTVAALEIEEKEASDGQG